MGSTARNQDVASCEEASVHMAYHAVAEEVVHVWAWAAHTVYSDSWRREGVDKILPLHGAQYQQVIINVSLLYTMAACILVF